MLALLLDPIFKDHRTAPGHPESPQRIEAVAAALKAANLTSETLTVELREASRDELARVHDPYYVDWVSERIASGVPELAGGDVSVGIGSDRIARLAVGGILEATDLVMRGAATTAFCATRPPGHHAGIAEPMGFCIFNGVAAAARHAQLVHGCERVAVLDWDVHHGNGTQEIFYDDASVLFCSTHQSPWYPGTGAAAESGAGPGIGTTINCPLPAGSGRTEVLGAFTETFLPAVTKFRPELILISAGFDGRTGDPLGQFHLTDQDFADLTSAVRATAESVCAGRVVSVLEGGYHLAGLASAVSAHVQALR